MLDNKKETSSSGESESDKNQIHPPTINLPIGGGAIRCTGEKFAANPVTGTGSMTVPIATSPGRSGFDPQLSLSYDSGSGNGPFSFGWSLSLPSITRRTDKGLPLYDDGAKSGVFIFSGAEDLVSVLGDDLQPLDIPARNIELNGTRTIYRIKRYRSRIEDFFACIEHWTNKADHIDVRWSSISKDNILTFCGLAANSRISDPDDYIRIFSWLICENRNDKDNATVCRHKKENGHPRDTRLSFTIIWTGENKKLLLNHIGFSPALAGSITTSGILHKEYNKAPDPGASGDRKRRRAT
jgi:hypothetical protein